MSGSELALHTLEAQQSPHRHEFCGGPVTLETSGVEEQVAHVTERLTAEYAGSVPPAVVQSLVSEVFSGLRSARVTQYVPVLVDRSVRQRLRQAQ
jgi:hypothetical protein